MTKRFAWISYLFLAAILVGCSGGDTTNSSDQSAESKPKGDMAAETTRDLPDPLPPAEEGVVKVNTGAEPPSFDPSLIADLPAYWVVHHLFEPLARMDNDGTMLPAAAESWEHNEDYTVWTFNIREGMEWSNGDPVTANDWVYSIKRTLDKETQAKYSMMVFNFLDNGKAYFEGELGDSESLGIKAVDDYTLEITLENSTPYFLSNVSHSIWYPQHEATIEEHGLEWAESPETFVNNGPYIIEEIRPKDRIRLTRNPNYWDADSVKIPEIQFLYIDRQDVELADFAAGNLDMTGQINNREAPRLVDEPEFYLAPMIGTYYVGFNNRRAPFNDVNVRKALALTVHRQLIVDDITQRGEIAAVGIVPGSMMINGESFRDLAPSYYDPENFGMAAEEAKKILEENNIDLPRMKYMFNQELIHTDIGENIQTVWNQVLGADVELEVVEWGVLLDRGRKGEFEMMRASWIGDYFDPLTFLEIFETGHGNNYVGYSNPVYDDLLAKIRSETDTEKRLEHMIEAERLLIEEDCVLAPVFEYVTPILVRTDLKNFVRTPLGGLDLTRAYRVGEA